MKHRLPLGMRQVSLPPGAQLFEPANTAKRSLLYPIRQYGGDFVTSGRVSTLEAVTALLRELDEPDDVSPPPPSFVILDITAICPVTAAQATPPEYQHVTRH